MNTTFPTALMGGYVGMMSALLGYPVTTWQFWFIAVPICAYVAWVNVSLRNRRHEDIKRIVQTLSRR